MFKHRLLSGRKLVGKNCLRVYGKLLLHYGLIFCFLLLLFLWLRTERLSRVKDLGDSRADELNRALRRLPVVDESRDSWRSPRVEGARILSAYLDTRPEVVLEEDSSLIQRDTAWAMIRIIGIVPVNIEDSPLTCHYRYRYRDNENTHVLSRRAIGTRLAAFQENFGMSYCAAFLLCELPGSEDIAEIKLPYEVSVSSEPEVDPELIEDDEYVVVRYPVYGWKNFSQEFEKNSENDVTKSFEKSVSKLSKKKSDESVEENFVDNSLAICVQPLHHRFDKALDFLAFVEFYRMMGAGRFTFYRDTVDPRIDKILDYYARIDIAIVLEWRLSEHYVYERNLRVDGIFAALNDCLYRSSFHRSYRYVAGVDIDEYIVPRKHDDIASMMDYLNDRRRIDSLTGAWIFRNMFFYLMHPDDETPLGAGLPQLKVHTKTTRWREINPPRDRSKFIVQGRDVIDMGNHHIWKLKRAWSLFGQRYKEVAVDPEIAGSHHYRKCETTVETCWLRPTVLDKAAHRFTPRLAERVANVSKTIFPGDSLWP